MVLMELQVQRVRKVFKGPPVLELRAQQEPSAPQARKGYQALPVLQAPVFRELPVRRDHRVRTELMEPQAQREQQVLRE